MPMTISPKKAQLEREGTDDVVKDAAKKAAARDSDNDGDDDSDDEDEESEEEEERNMLPLETSDSEDDDVDDSGEMLARATLVKAAVKAHPSSVGEGKKSTTPNAKMAPKKSESGSEEETDSSDGGSDTADREKASRPQVSTWNLIENVLVVSVRYLEGTSTWNLPKCFGCNVSVPTGSTAGTIQCLTSGNIILQGLLLSYIYLKEQNHRFLNV